MDCHFFLQGIFLTQRSNPGLLHCRLMLYRMSHQGIPQRAMKVKVEVKSFLTLCDPMGCSLPGSSIRGIFQAKVLEWVAISFSRGSSLPWDQTHVPCTGRWILTTVLPGNSRNIFKNYNLFTTGEGNSNHSNGTPLQYFCLENSMDGGAW